MGEEQLFGVNGERRVMSARRRCRVGVWTCGRMAIPKTKAGQVEFGAETRIDIVVVVVIIIIIMLASWDDLHWQIVRFFLYLSPFLKYSAFLSRLAGFLTKLLNTLCSSAYCYNVVRFS